MNKMLIEQQRRSWLDLSSLEPAGRDFLAARDAPAIDDDRVKLCRRLLAKQLGFCTVQTTDL